VFAGAFALELAARADIPAGRERQDGVKREYRKPALGELERGGD
jgi:hypothetical protein